MISILMATYNGERFLQEQLDSVLSQTFSNFTIHVSDDCSTDSTWQILEEYAEKSPKIRISRRHENTGSAKHNFLGLMTEIRDDYIMLCDQDDVWLPDKIEKTLAKMQSMERENGVNTPILVHTDLTVTDENLAVKNPSYKAAMNSDFSRTAFNQVLIQNTLTGCTALYNRALAELLTTAPKYCVMHDWWLKLVAAAFGRIGHLEEQTVLYRQHGGNAIGAKDVRTLSYKIGRLLNGGSVKEAIKITYPQAESLLDIYDNVLTLSQKQAIEKYCKIPQLGKLARWRTITELNSLKCGFFRNVAYFIFV
ncbi:MAG: glycosyltransferase family 2 protein [Turicibacter sp.]|nr:glycosyltransferase family 2 protein [Turicibacter sp.]